MAMAHSTFEKIATPASKVVNSHSLTNHMSYDAWYRSCVSHDDTLPGDGAVVTNATVVTGSTINPLVV